jgi:hypothetical protein
MNSKEGNRTDVYSMWNEFNSAVQDQMTQAIKTGQKGCDVLHESWSDMATRMADHAGMLDPAVPETMEVYNVWRNYSAKMARRMDVVVHEREERLNRLIETWGDWAPGLGKRMSDATAGDNAATFEGAYTDWLIFSGRFLAEIMRGMDGSGTNVDELVSTWKRFSKTMGDAVDRLVKRGGEDYRELNKAWLEFAEAVGERLDSFADDSEGDFAQLYETWLRESQTLGRKMAQTVPQDDTEGATDNESASATIEEGSK